MHDGRIGIRSSCTHVIEPAIDRIAALLIGVEPRVYLGDFRALRNAVRKAIFEEILALEFLGAGLLHQDAVSFAIGAADVAAARARLRTR